MAFQNVFDAGAQTVYVDAYDDENGTWSWSGSLAKGGSHTFTDPQVGTNSYTISVTSDGQVVASSANATTAVFFDVYVAVPSNIGSVQLANYISAKAAAMYDAYATASNGSVTAAPMTATGPGSPATPNPFNFPVVDATLVYGVNDKVQGAAAGEMFRFTLEYDEAAPSGNLFNQASEWVDDQFVSPPRWWDGTKYAVFSNNDNGFESAFLQATTTGGMSTVQDGDTIAFSLVNHQAPVYQAGHSGGKLQLLVNGVVVYEYSLDTVGTDEYASAALTAGSDVLFRLTEGAGPYALYGTYDFDLLPAGATPSKFWTNFIGCEEL